MYQEESGTPEDFSDTRPRPFSQVPKLWLEVTKMTEDFLCPGSTPSQWGQCADQCVDSRRSDCSPQRCLYTARWWHRDGQYASYVRGCGCCSAIRSIWRHSVVIRLLCVDYGPSWVLYSQRPNLSRCTHLRRYRRFQHSCISTIVVGCSTGNGHVTCVADNCGTYIGRLHCRYCRACIVHIQHHPQCARYQGDPRSHNGACGRGHICACAPPFSCTMSRHCCAGSIGSCDWERLFKHHVGHRSTITIAKFRPTEGRDIVRIPAANQPLAEAPGPSPPPALRVAPSYNDDSKSRRIPGRLQRVVGRLIDLKAYLLIT
jgi:hypothetical protein